jgi:hypothetical protein
VTERRIVEVKVVLITKKVADVNYMKKGKLRQSKKDRCARGTRSGYVVRAGRQARRIASCSDAEYLPTARKDARRKRTWPGNGKGRRC